MHRLLLLSILLFPALAFCADPPRRTAASDPAADVVKAATADAVRNLYHEISKLPVSFNLNVGQLLANTDSRDEFMLTLDHANQMGSPRWLDAATCQVELQIPAARIVNALNQIAAANPKTAKVTPWDIARFARTWPSP